MAAYPEFEIEDLADFSGRPAVMIPAYADEAISQAVFLVRLRTGLKSWPDDPDLQQLMRYAILDLANRMELEASDEVAKIRASPASSQSMGSFSWSKSGTAQTSRYKAWPTGIEWLDILLEYLADLDSEHEPMMTHGSVHIVDDHIYHDLDSGETWMLGPADIDTYRRRYGQR